MNPKEVQRLKERAPLPLIVTVIMFFAPQFLIDPLIDNLETTGKTFDGLVAQVQGALRQRTLDQGLSARRAAVRREMDRLEAWLPPEDYLPTLIDQFNALADILGVEIRSVTYRFPSSTPEAGPSRRVDIHLALAASYEAMRSFLQAVEGLPSPLVLTEVVANQDQTFTVSLQHLVKP
jgi:Tfp pilus assembly protein PilO